MFFEQVIRDNLDIGRRPGESDLRPQLRAADRRRRAGSGPGDHLRGHRACTWTTSTPPSSSTTRKEKPADRDHHQRHRDFGIGKRLTICRTAGDRLHRQPSPAARPTTQPRPDHRNRRLAAITGTLTTTSGVRIPGLQFAEQRTTRCYPHCSCSGATRTDSPTKTCALHASLSSRIAAWRAGCARIRRHGRPTAAAGAWS